MNIEEILNHKVVHRIFGKGSITTADNDYIEVEFADGAIKKFQCPKAFESFLTIDDEKLQQELLDESAKKDHLKDVEKKEYLKPKTEVYRKQSIEMGDSFSTHAEALNDCFGFDYKHFQKAYKVLDNDYAVWFPNIAKQVLGEYLSTDRTSGWVNILADAGRSIIQMDQSPENPQTDRDERYKIIFARFDGEDRYRFIGVFDFGERVERGYKSKRVGTKFDTINMKVIE